ncbi:hypothetical protein [Thiobacillus denitrificans]|uniref:hypothetical protein n=1 Tax=Thiobacillus denitrificans TaxID=36861 RepID=UPI0018728FE2|nr:hypothetical protein [Thiobacillus denitrificans]
MDVLLLPLLVARVGAAHAVPLLTVAQLICNLARAGFGFPQIRCRSRWRGFCWARCRTAWRGCWSRSRCICCCMAEPSRKPKAYTIFNRYDIMDITTTSKTPP